MPTLEDFQRIDIRAGTVVRCERFPEARTPAYKLWIDFGPEVGVKQSSARITDLYEPDALVGRQVLGVVNFPALRVGPFVSEALTLGVYGDGGTVILVGPDRDVPNGSRLG